MYEFPLLIFNISGGEILFLLLVVLIVFGPSKIPSMARQLGKIIFEMKKATNDITREFRDEYDGVKNEFESTKQQIREETDAVKREIDQTKEETRKKIDEGKQAFKYPEELEYERKEKEQKEAESNVANQEEDADNEDKPDESGEQGNK
ncbi:MAG: twin-arginine translocase TatA/TatE family subunit [Bacteroidales bacterium]|nr:twin-arginine translocase TatA/TatE family subunit [Bacteroidales bacterium]